MSVRGFYFDIIQKTYKLQGYNDINVAAERSLKFNFGPIFDKPPLPGHITLTYGLRLNFLLPPVIDYEGDDLTVSIKDIKNPFWSIYVHTNVNEDGKLDYIMVSDKITE